MLKQVVSQSGKLSSERLFRYTINSGEILRLVRENTLVAMSRKQIVNLAALLAVQMIVAAQV
ncbi:hypothetical protein T265_15858, partial [Opisthorchis viverrini]